MIAFWWENHMGHCNRWIETVTAEYPPQRFWVDRSILIGSLGCAANTWTFIWDRLRSLVMQHQKSTNDGPQQVNSWVDRLKALFHSNNQTTIQYQSQSDAQFYSHENSKMYNFFRNQKKNSLIFQISRFLPNDILTDILQSSLRNAVQNPRRQEVFPAGHPSELVADNISGLFLASRQSSATQQNQFGQLFALACRWNEQRAHIRE